MTTTTASERQALRGLAQRATLSKLDAPGYGEVWDQNVGFIAQCNTTRDAERAQAFAKYLAAACNSVSALCDQVDELEKLLGETLSILNWAILECGPVETVDIRNRIQRTLDDVGAHKSPPWGGG